MGRVDKKERETGEMGEREEREKERRENGEGKTMEMRERGERRDWETGGGGVLPGRLRRSMSGTDKDQTSSSPTP